MQQQIDESRYDAFYIQYEERDKPIVDKVIQNIANNYATFKFVNYSEHFLKTINQYYHEIKLTKRKIVFAVIMPTDNPEICPVERKRINLTFAPKEKCDVLLDSTVTQEQLQVELIKRFQLDSIWVGLLYRIGVDVQGLEDYLQKEENFSKFNISFISRFYALLQENLSKETQFSYELLENCKKELMASDVVDLLNFKVEELIRSQFNSRMILSDITNLPHIHLLASRNYFNLIYIQGQIFNRYEHFRKNVLTDYPHLKSILNFGFFVLLDDYIYSEFIFNCLGKVKKYINRIINQQPYSQVVAKHHKDIIREFRPSYNEYFLNICLVLKERAACLKEAVGSIIVKNNKIISTGYNGTPVGTVNCYNGGCQVCNNSQKMNTEVLSCRCIHAEYNCILKAGIACTPGATLYSSKMPCLWCSKLIIQGRIKQVICIRSKYSPLQYDNFQLVKQTLERGKVYVEEIDIPLGD